ncbi:hypothetical protein EI969_27310 [Pseudomonas sp. PB101]|nr:hypothetical protein [Pseudomonas sp. PB101]
MNCRSESDSHVASDRQPSRASPLPHWNAFPCGSGLARDGAIKNNTRTSHPSLSLSCIKRLDS